MRDNIKKVSLSKLQLSITLILILVFCITGATYAYFAITKSDSATATGNLATVNLTLDVTKVFPTQNNNTGVMVPQLSSFLENALKSGCVDANGNVVCQVYKVNIRNVGGTATQVVDGRILFYSDLGMTIDIRDDMPNLRWKLITSANATTPSNSVLGDNSDLIADAVDNEFASEVTMVTNSSFDYYIIVWISETNSDQPTDEGKTFYAKVKFDSSNGTGVTGAFSSYTQFSG